MVVNEQSRLVNDYLGNDRRASMELQEQSVFQVLTGPLFQYAD
jgi:hypothetical protein